VASLAWLLIALFALSLFRLAAISDARREAELAEWLAMNVRVEQRASELAVRADRLRSESRPRLRRAAS
jgi:hypothetical protein